MKRPTQLGLVAITCLGFALPAFAQETSAFPDSNPPPALSDEPVEHGTEAPPADRGRSRWSEPLVMIGQDVELKEGESAEAVVVIFGSAKVRGDVDEGVVAVFGDVEVDGRVGDAVVSVMGNTVLGANARIDGDAVAVMGSLTAAPGAEINGDAVAVGSRLNASGATIHGQKVQVGLPFGFIDMSWLRSWLVHCVFMLRPLAPQVGWVWVVAGVFFLLNLACAVIFPRPVQACIGTLTGRPVTTLLMGLLTKLLVPLLIFVLAITGIGLLAVPFVLAALFVGAIIGKVAILEWIGMRIGQQFGAGFQTPLIAFLLGSILVTLLYMIPLIGLLVYTLISIWGLGSAVSAAFSNTRREMPPRPASPPAPPGAPDLAPIAAAAGAASGSDAAFSAAAPVSPVAGVSQSGSEAPVGGAEPPVQSTGTGVPLYSATAMTSSLPRAGFWERMGAAFLDVMLISLVVGLGGGGFFYGSLAALAYFAGMWAWRGTTIGGIVLQLKVVRVDGGPLTFLVALVRGLAAAFSAAVLFLGFLWIAFDPARQAWHDKIAGTEVVRLPRSAPLVCV